MAMPDKIDYAGVDGKDCDGAVEDFPQDTLFGYLNGNPADPHGTTYCQEDHLGEGFDFACHIGILVSGITPSGKNTGWVSCL